jgi:propanol-preferring alcohol dehydrogenase
MKSLFLISPQPIEANPLRLHDVPIPVPAKDDILIRVRACGVCHTDLHVIEGDLPQRKSPIVPGHQIVGVVEKIGADVTGHKIGARVGVAWLGWTCGDCMYCKRGEENLCDRAKFTGYDIDGGFAEYMVVHSDYAYSLPEQFSDVEAAPLLCAGIIGFRALRLSGVPPGGKLGLFGFGASAHITIQVARHWGCEVYVFSRSERHRQFAEQLGAVWTGKAGQMPPAPLDGAISFAPVGELVPEAMKVLRKGGTLALAGVYMSALPPLEYSAIYYERVLRSVANSTRQDARDFLTIAGEIPLKTTVEVFPFKEANRALQLVKSGDIHGAAVLAVQSTD